MKRSHLFLFMLVGTFGLWFMFEQLFNVFIGYNLPFIGNVGVEPFVFMREYGILIGGAAMATLYLLLGRNTK